MNLPTEWIPLLQGAGHGLSESTGYRLDAMGDRQLLRRLHARPGLRHDARPQRGRWPQRPAGALLDVLPEVIGTLVLSLLKSYGPEIDVGALVLADERCQRVRILPLRRGKPNHCYRDSADIRA
jgi:hypothetical protein